MTLDDFYAHFNLPDSAKLGVPIYKKQLLENTTFSSADRKLIKDHVDTVRWRYALKPANCAIARYDDSEREYGEIAVLHIRLKALVGTTHLKRLSDLLQRAIPYPLILVFVAAEATTTIDMGEQQIATQLALCLADKRINRVDASKLTLSHLFETSWLKLDELSEVEAAFLRDLNASQCDQQNLYALYSDWTRCTVALDIARRIGQYQRSRSSVVDQHRLQILQAMRDCESQLASQHAQLKTETQFNRQLERNVQIKKIQQELADYRVQLAEDR